MKKRILKISAILVAVAALFLGGLAIYAADYYHADEAAVAALESSDTVTVETARNMVIFLPQNPQAGFIFYPGGKVEYTAYAPLMHSLAKEGIACIITKMPFNLAVMDTNAADKAVKLLGDADKLYIG